LLRTHAVRDALPIARRLRDAAPNREISWRLLIEALTLGGDWVQAAVEADGCESTLRGLGRKAEPATLAAIRAARKTPLPTTRASTRLVAELIGRGDRSLRPPAPCTHRGSYRHWEISTHPRLCQTDFRSRRQRDRVASKPG
jgi:hypothetical protein